ncbi:MAG: DUF433 domain-containing protein [Chloroflexota bacterium]
METVLSINLITTNPAVRGGRPCVVGTGVRVSDIAIIMLFHHQTPSEIAEWFGLSMAQVHAALAFYYEHKAEIDEDIRQQIATARDFKEKRIGSRGSLLSG